MKLLRNKILFLLTLIVVISMGSFGTTVYAGDSIYLIEDYGYTPSAWTSTKNKLVNAYSLNNGPPRGNSGHTQDAFYFFRHSGDNTREMSEASAYREVELNQNLRTLCNYQQLYARFSLDYFGWNGEDDRFEVTIYCYKANGSRTTLYSSGYYVGDSSWRTLNMSERRIPEDTVKIRVEIYADRESNSDLDVYLDNIMLWVFDKDAPVMTEAKVVAIKDDYRRDIPLKTDGEGNYLTTWINRYDTVYGEISFNEPVSISNPSINLCINVNARYGAQPYAVVDSSLSAYLTKHTFRIFFLGEPYIDSEDNRLQFVDNPYGDTYYSAGYFSSAVRDLGGNNGPSSMMKPNIDHYNIKIDSAAPNITTPWNSYTEYVPGRSSVQITVEEIHEGLEQSPVILKYSWQYTDSTKKSVREERSIVLNSSNSSIVSDEIKTTYTVNLDIPNGSSIPPNQVFTLSAEVTDEARNQGDVYSFFGKVNQVDITPPNITWDKSVRHDGTWTDLSTTEDTLYSTNRTITFMVNDPDSGVSDVKYLWSRESYDYDINSFKKVLLPDSDGKYTIEATSEDFPNEGMYYLNILAVNGTGEYVVKRKGFYFDCIGPRLATYVLNEVNDKPSSIYIRVRDRAMQSKFLYAFITTTDYETLTFEELVEPDVSEGIKDSGQWKAVSLIGDGELREANITGVLDQVHTSSVYKIVFRFYDEFMNCGVDEEQIWYDFDPPEILYYNEPMGYSKNHEVNIRLTDSFSGIRFDKMDHSATWINVETGESIPVSYIMYYLQETGMIVNGKEDFNGRYKLKVRIYDYSGNYLEEVLHYYVDSNPLDEDPGEKYDREFLFDNSPPEVNLELYADNKASTISFSYSDLWDEYSNVGRLAYGISQIPGVDPTNWIDVTLERDFEDKLIDNGTIEHTAEITDGTWYLSVLMEDEVGNRQIIHCPEAFEIDSTKPDGEVSFEKDHTNQLDVSLKLTLDELADVGRKTFKVKLAKTGDMSDSEWKDLIFENGEAHCSWKLDDIDDGEQSVYAQFMDDAGNISDLYEDTIMLDRTPPTGSVTYDITAPTNEDVTATLVTVEENIVLNNNGSKEYVFNRNGEFEFIISDPAGNRAWIPAVAENIDKDPPKAYVTYSESLDKWTNESIVAELHFVDEDGYEPDEVVQTHTFLANGTYTFHFTDSLGNEGSITAEVKNIDKVAPIGTILYNGSEELESDTAPVTVYLSVDEQVEVTNNDGSFRYVFEDNGEFTFEFTDKAGNTGTATATVDTITSAEKYVEVLYSDTGMLTNSYVDVEIKTFADLAIITAPTVAEEVYGYTHRFTENGEVDVYIKVLSGDEEGNIRTITASVHNIDREAPDAYVILSTTEPTNQDVTVSLLAYDDKGKRVDIINNNGSNTYVFEENGSFTFELMDEAGNITEKTVTVSNIDKTAPVGVVEYTPDPEKKIVTARITFPDETEAVTILNNNGSDTYVFGDNGAFTFEYADKAGNKGTTTATVTAFSSTAREAEIEYYIDGVKIDEPNAEPTNKSVTAKLIISSEGAPYTILNNGGSDSYTFEQNGEFTFVYQDAIGNVGFAKAYATTIDKVAPKLQISANTVKPTQSDVIITITYSDDKGNPRVVHNLETGKYTASEGMIVYTCENNKDIVVTVTDDAGNETTREFKVDYIDRTPPEGTIKYIPGSLTNDEVIAELEMNEAGKVVNNNGRSEYVFTDNGEFTFEFEDRAGNRATATARVNWIDKIPPNASLSYSHTGMSKNPVTVTVNTDSDAIILNNGGLRTRTFYTNGIFTFRVSDEAGNVVELKAEVWNIDEEKPQITLQGYQNTVLMLNEPYVEPGYKAVDNIDGDLTDKVVVEGSVNTAVPGTYSIKYRVSDAVGNTAEVIRTVRVMEPDELLFMINGTVTDASMLVLDTQNVILDIFGNEGECLIKSAEGRRPVSWFKSNGSIVRTGLTRLEPGKWNTLYAQDRERKTKTISIYINE